MWCGPTVKLFLNFFKEIPLVFLFSLQRDMRLKGGTEYFVLSLLFKP